MIRTSLYNVPETDVTPQITSNVDAVEEQIISPR